MPGRAPICFQTFHAARARMREAGQPETADLIESYGHIGELLADHAERIDPAGEVDREIDQLLALQSAIVTSVAARPATALHEVIDKLALWAEAREPESDDGGPEDALVLSALRDLQRLLASA